MTTGWTTARRLHVSGIVQGVGFRPFVYGEAAKHGLSGWVRNTTAGVEILAQGSEPQIALFVEALRTSAPQAARIDRIEESREKPTPEIDCFKIIESSREGAKEARLLPDLATCPECLREMRDPSNRRHRYPFINCTHCGPRYSITRQLPYDRINTTMRSFTMCPECRCEYEDPEDRRFHAQPNACPACGPQLALWDKQGRTIAARDDALLETAQHVRHGGIVAVKGIGGFHLVCDASNDQAVRRLRERKHRAEKPFAIMTADVAMASMYAQVSEREKEWLSSTAAPIVLLQKKNWQSTSALSEAVAPGQNHLGIMLPYAPLHHLLMDELKRPLVATSGNISDEPICTDEYDALARLGGIADFFLIHNRPIAHAVDDSVMRIALDRPLRMRVARGLAPLSLPRPAGTGTEPLLAVGPHMKSTLALATSNQFIISPHIGDLETVPAWQAFECNLETLQGLYEVAPAAIACDRHPDYASTSYARRRSKEALAVQHHHAHILSVMAEHGLREHVLGIALDGTGYGDDNTIWGGEILAVDDKGYRRVAHLRTFPLPGGDVAAREPRRSLLGVMTELDIGNVDAGYFGFQTGEYNIIAKMIRRKFNTARTSSAGRLFDAVAALLGLCMQSSFEGQSAMLVQAEAEKAPSEYGTYPVLLDDGEPARIDWEPCIRGMLRDQRTGIDAPRIARRFHRWLADALLAVADRYPDIPVVLGGGCFQNTLLLTSTVSSLRSRGRMVYWPDLMPPNDGGISAGQLLAAGWSTAR